jgi:hypothetical protein
MSSRVNHPLKSLLLFALVGALGYGAWYAIVERKLLEGNPEQFLNTEERDEVRDLILTRYREERCFLELGSLVYRPKENIYRIDFRVGYACDERAREMCQEISVMVEEAVGKRTTAWARDDAGNEVAHFVP